MRILVLAESLNYDRTSEGGCTSKFLLGLRLEGCEVTCLHSDYTRRTFPWLNKISLISFKNKPWSAYNVLAKLGRILPSLDNWVKLRTGFSSKFWHETRMYAKQIKRHLQATPNYDLVIVRSAGSSFRTHFAMCKSNYSGKWIAHFHDPFPFSQYPKPYRDYPIGFEKQELKVKSLIQKSPFVSVASNFLKNWIEEFSGRKNGLIVMPHTALDLFPKLESKRNLKCVLLHSGALLKERNPVALLNAFERILESNFEIGKEIILKFQGNINSPLILNAFESFKNKYPESIIYSNQRLSYEESINDLNLSDFAIVLEAEESYSPFLPGKFVDAITYGKPIFAISPKRSEIRTILGSNYPYLADSLNENEIYEALLLAYDFWKSKKDPVPEMLNISLKCSTSNIFESLQLVKDEKIEI